MIILHSLYWEVRGSWKCLDCNLHSSVSVAICAAVLVCVSTGLRDVCSVPVWLVLHSSFSHPKTDVTRTMGSGRLLWRPTGGRLKVSPPRSAQQMEAEVIICCSVHLLTPHSSLPSLTLTALLYCKDVSDQLWWDWYWMETLTIKCFTSYKHIRQLKRFVLLSIKAHYHGLLCGCDKFFLVYRSSETQQWA